MRAALAHRAQRLRSSSLSAVPPPPHSPDYSPDYASAAASILYRSPLPSESGLPVYVLNAAAFPDAHEIDYDSLLPYVLARLPGEEELIAGEDYEVVFFAGGQPESATAEKKNGPGIGWYLQAYHVLSRAVRKRLQRLYVVHERSWVRVLIEVFGTIVSPKFRKKIVHFSTLSSLACHIKIEDLLIPPSVYLHDRRVSSDIHSPYVSGRRAFAASDPLPRNLYGQRRLPRLLRETTSFICTGDNITTEGLFRIPAHSTLVSVLREAYDRGQQFIVWKEGAVAYTQPDMDPDILGEVHQADAYGVHLAAGLIKLWYRELKSPIFLEYCYDEMRYKFGNQEHDIELQDLAELLSPKSTTSCMTPVARLILTTHLIPLMSLVTSYEPTNKMTPENLAIVFSPALVCGSDQLADAKMTSVLRRLLHAAIEWWPHGLREACDTTADAFAAAIRPPPSRQDYEDPLDTDYHSPEEDPQELQHRITLQDEESEKPALPPRPPRPSSSSKPNYPARSDSLATPVKRKPAAIGGLPPRYSSLQSRSASDSGSPSSYPSPVEAVALDVKVARSPKQAQAATPPGAKAPTPIVPSQTDLMKELKNSLQTEIVVRRKPVSSSASPISPTSPPSAARNNAPVFPQQRSASARGPPTSRSSDVFAKPAWPASARPPTVVTRKSSAASTASQAGLAAPSFAPRPRTPSPGLLKRMASIESTRGAAQTDGLKVVPVAEKLGLRKASVDDLKRLYEERLSMSTTLADAQTRRASDAT